MTLVLVLLVILAVMAAVGWARFEWTKERATLSIETRVIREKTGRAVARCRQLLARFGDRLRSHNSGSHEETHASEAGAGPSAAGHRP
jgi:hypothetical protein